MDSPRTEALRLRRRALQRKRRDRAKRLMPVKAEATLPVPCRCERPHHFDDEGERRCLLCGRAKR